MDDKCGETVASEHSREGETIPQAATPTMQLRRNLGIYYTPVSAAQFIANWAIQSPGDSILEPSFGGCALLRAAFERLSALGCATPMSSLTGFDIDSAAFTHLATFGIKPLSGFLKQDFLTTRPQNPCANVVMANPPFVGYRSMSGSQRAMAEQWRNDYAIDLPRDAGLWAYFLAHSLHYLQQGGRIAFVLPATYLVADYAGYVRNHVEQRFSEVTIVEVRERLFFQEGADERTVILLASGYLGSTGIHKPRRITVDSLARLPLDLGADFIHCETTGQANALSRMPSDLITAFSEVGKVCIGEVTGDSDFFVRTREEWLASKIPLNDLVPVVRRSSDISGVRIDRNTVPNLPLMLRPKIGRMSPAVRRYLSGYDVEQVSSKSTFRKRDPWYAISYDTQADAFVPSLSHAFLRFAINSAGVSCTNSMYKLTLVEKERRPNIAAVCVAWHTSIAQLSAEALSRTMGAGALKLEPSDVKKLVLPRSALALDARKANALVASLNKLTQRGDFDAARRLADEAIATESAAPLTAFSRAAAADLLELRSSRMSSSARQLVK